MKCRRGCDITDLDGNLPSELWNGEEVIITDVYPEKALDMRKKNHGIKVNYPSCTTGNKRLQPMTTRLSYSLVVEGMI